MAAEALAITGFGLISAAAIDDDDKLAELLRTGGTALARRSRIEAPDPRWTGSVPEQLDLHMSALADGVGQRLCVQWAIRAGWTALTRAGVDLPGRPRAAALGLVLASNLEDQPLTLAELAVEIADALGLQGPRVVTSMACASSLAALSLARMMLTNADLDAVLVVGADVLTPRVIAAFDRLSLLCERACAPFSVRVGTSLGEGAAALVIERMSSAGAATIVASVLGEGLAADAHHPTAPEPNGRGTQIVIDAALIQAGLEAREIHMVLAHGTGTLANDAAELCGLERAYLSPTDTPIVALKSVFGHAQGAAGAVELAAMLVAWARSITPVTASFEGLRAGASWRVSQAGAARPPVPERVVLNSAGFGGTSAAVIVARGRVEPRDRVPPGHDHAPVYLQRWASAGWDALDDTINWRRAVRGVDLRAVDPSTRLLTLAVDRALPRSRDSGTGLIVAQARSSVAAVARLRDEIERHGLEHAAGSALAEPLTIMPAGGCARIIGLCGPFGLCVADAGAHMLALCWAAAQLRWRQDCSQIVAAVLDETPGDQRDGAGALVLARAGQIRLAGWAMLGAGQGEQALARACEQAGLAPERLDRLRLVDHVDHADHVDHDKPDRSSGVARGASALLQTCESIEPSTSAAVIVDEPTRAAIAIVLIRDGVDTR